MIPQAVNVERGRVLGAMENGCQRGKLQEESRHGEMRKGGYPIIGVNTFCNPKGGRRPGSSGPRPTPPAIEEARQVPAVDG